MCILYIKQTKLTQGYNGHHTQEIKIKTLLNEKEEYD